MIESSLGEDASPGARDSPGGPGGAGPAPRPGLTVGSSAFAPSLAGASLALASSSAVAAAAAASAALASFLSFLRLNRPKILPLLGFGVGDAESLSAS